MIYVLIYFIMGIFVSVMYEIYYTVSTFGYRPNLTSILMSTVLWPLCIYALLKDIKNG